MAQHVQIGSLLYNVLMMWATLQKPPITSPGQSLSLPLPQNKNKWVHPVIFEPQPKIQLTQSSYKVTSFFDFQPFLKGFQSVYQYLKDFKEELDNPRYIQRLIYEVKPFRSLPCQMKPLSINTLIQKYVNITPSVVGQNINLNNIN